MHELSVTQALLDLVVERAAAVQAAIVTDIYIEIGQLTSYVDDSVQFYWDLISGGTAAEGANLHFNRTPMSLQCTHCGTAFPPDGETFSCPACGSQQVQVTSGGEFLLVGLDVEKAPRASNVEV